MEFSVVTFEHDFLNQGADILRKSAQICSQLTEMKSKFRLTLWLMTLDI